MQPSFQKYNHYISRVKLFQISTLNTRAFAPAMNLKCFITRKGEVAPNNETWQVFFFFCLCFFAATSSLLSSARWVCCEELPLMIISEIRAHYDEFVDHQPRSSFPAHDDQSRLKRVSPGSARTGGSLSSCF